MATIDSLDIQIEGSAQKATTAIDSVVKNLDKLAKSLKIDTSGLERLGKINSDNFKKLGEGAKDFSSGLKSLQNIKKSDFNRLASGIERLSSVSTGNMQAVASTLKPLADGVSILSNVNFDNKNLQGMINSLTRLSNSNVSNLSNVDFTGIGNSIKNLTNSLAGADKVQQSTISMTNAIAKLAASGANIPIVSTSLSQLGTSLSKFMSTMSAVPAVTSQTIAFTQAIAQLSNAGGKAATTASNLGALATELKAFMKTMSNAPIVSDNTIRMTQALADLASQGNKTSSATQGLQAVFSGTENIGNKFNNSIKKLSYSMKGLGDSVKKTASKMKSFKTELLSAFGIVGGLYGAISGIRKSIDISSDLVEVQNVVDTTFKNMSYKVEELAKTSIEQFGLSELSLKQFSSRFQAMGTAMGFPISRMSDMSIELTKLTADMSSFYNVAQEDVARSLQSIFTGETEPLRKYGLDLTQATLQEWALKQGLDADMRAMSQAEKTMIRYQYVIANTTAAQGDFAKTANTWANQIRILRQQFEQLASIIGTAFVNMLKPVVQSLNKAMAKVIEFAQTVINALGKIFGWKFEINTKGIAGDFSGIEDGIGGITDGIEDATEASKKFNKQLQGFDKLNNLTTSDAGKGLEDLTAGLGDAGDIGDIVPSEGLFDKYESDIDTLYKLGKYLGETLKNFLDNIPWDAIKKKAREIGEGIADLINGFIEVDGLGYSIGKSLIEAINTGFELLNAFVHRLHWESVGHFIADTLNGFFENIDWELIRDTFVTGFKGLADAINQFIADFHWDNISNTISNAINIIAETVYTFFSTVNWDEWGSNLGNQLMESIRKIDWHKVGMAIGSVVQSALDFLKSFISQLDMSEIAKAFMTALKGFFEVVDAGDLAVAILTVISAKLAFKAASFSFNVVGKAISKKLESAILSGLGNIGELFGKFGTKFSGGFSKLVSGIGGIGTSLASAYTSLGGIGGILTTDLGTIFGAGTFAEIGLTAGTALVGALAGAFAGGAIGKALDNYVIAPIAEAFGDKELAEQYRNFKFFGEDGFFETLGSSISDGTWKDAFKLMGEDIKSSWSENVENIKSGWNELVENVRNSEWIESIREKVNSIGEWFSNAWNNAKEAWTTTTQWFDETIIQPIAGFFEGLSTRIQQVFEGLRIITEAIWITISSWFNENVVTPIAELFKKLKETVQAVWENVSSWFNENVITPVVTFFQGLWETVSGFFTQLWEDIKTVWVLVSEWFNTTVIIPVVEFFRSAWESISGFFTNLWSDIQTVWGNVTSWFENTIIIPVQNAFSKACEAIAGFFNRLWSGIKKGVSGAFNGILSGIESAINWIVGGVNKVIGGFNKVVSWAAKITGDSWGSVNLVPTVSLPRIPALAKGAVFRGGEPYMAVVNDQPRGQTNVETPLRVIQQALREEMTSQLNSQWSGANYQAGMLSSGNSSETVSELRQQNKLLQKQNELLQAILEKPNISDGEIYNSFQYSYQSQAKRKGVTSLDPVLA